MNYKLRLHKSFGWIDVDRIIKSTTSSNNLSNHKLLEIYSDEVAEVYNFYKSKYNLPRDLDDIIVSIEVGESDESSVAFRHTSFCFKGMSSEEIKNLKY